MRILLPLMSAILFTNVPSMAFAQTPSLLGSPDATRLELQARGVVRVVPDRAVITAGVVTQATDANGALRANAQRMAAVMGAVRAAGIADKDVRTQSVTLSPQYRYSPNEAPVVTGYQASNMLTLSIADVARVGPVIDALVRQGVNEVNGPSFVVMQRQAAEDQARQEAVRLLQARAALYAKAMGLQVRHILSLSEVQDAGATAMPFVAARALAIEDPAPKTAVSAGEQDIVVAVSAIIELGPKP